MQDNETADLKSLPLYKEDWLGLKTLDEEGKLVFLEQPGHHMEHHEDWFTQNIVKPFLL